MIWSDKNYTDINFRGTKSTAFHLSSWQLKKKKKQNQRDLPFKGVDISVPIDKYAFFGDWNHDNLFMWLPEVPSYHIFYTKKAVFKVSRFFIIPCPESVRLCC